MRTSTGKTTEMDLTADPTICSVHGLDFEFEWSYGRLIKKFCAGCEDDQQRQAAEKRERDRIELQRQQVLAAWAYRQSQAGIPTGYRSASVETLLRETSAQRAVYEVAQQFVGSEGRDPANLSLLGPLGTGKTFAVIAIANGFLCRGKSVAYCTAIGLVRRIRSTWYRQSKRSEEQVVKALTEVHLLVIDEMGVQAGSEHELAILSDLVNARYSQSRPTIVVGNLTARELKTTLGERAMDRLLHGGKIMILNGENLRERFPAPTDEGETTCPCLSLAQSNDLLTSHRLARVVL